MLVVVVDWQGRKDIIGFPVCIIELGSGLEGIGKYTCTSGRGRLNAVQQLNVRWLLEVE